MHFMVELHYQKQHREAALKYFWEHGTTHYDAHVTVQEGWVATQDRIAYVLVEGDNADAVAVACEPMNEFGNVSFRVVTSFDEM